MAIKKAIEKRKEKDQMKKKLLILISLLLLFSFYSKKDTAQPTTQQEENPFFSAYNTPFETPPFDRIKEAHYLPAFQEGIKQQQTEVEAIANNSETPTFENTIEALERSGALLTKVSSVFDNLTEANTNDTLQNIAKEVAPLLSKLQDDINLNEKLFQKVKAVYEQKGKLNLSPEQSMLLEKYYKGFVRGGANLDETQKAGLREINKELAL